MTVKVSIPTALRGLTGGKGEVQAAGKTVQEVIDDLEARHPGMRDRLCDPSGDLRRFVNVYVQGEDIRFSRGLSTALKEGDEVSIIPAVAGG